MSEMLWHKMKTMLQIYVQSKICIKCHLQVTMDRNNNEFSSLNWPIEVTDNSFQQNNVTEGKRKRKRSTSLMEYLCKRRKRHAINKEKKKLSKEESYAGKYQDEFTKCNHESVDNDVDIPRKRRHVKSRLGLYQSRFKNTRYVKQLMKSNPVKYAEAFRKEKQKQNKRKVKKERKEVSSPAQYILNEHTGNLEKKESVQIPSCRKCNGVVKRDAETQVHPRDILGKVFCNSSIQCQILQNTETNVQCDRAHTAEIVTVSEDHVSHLKSTQMEHMHVTSCEEIKKSQIAGVNNREIHNNSTVVGQKITEDRTSKGKNLNDTSDEENDVMYNINGEDYKKICLAKLCDKELMTKLVEVLYDSSTLEDFVKLITQLSEGTLDAMNMSFLLCLQVAKLKSLKSTTAMRFRRETKQFWEVVYRICHGKRLQLFSGLKNQGCLQSGGERGSYARRKATTTLLYQMRSH